MNLVKKILVVHGDPKVKRHLVLALADAGYDLRAYVAAAPALETAKAEWFDLAIVDAQLRGAEEFAFVEALKQIQPTAPVVLLVPQLELPLIIQGIRMGLADVMSSYDELPAIVRRVNSLLRPDGTAADDHGLTAAELAAAEAVLEKVGPVSDESYSHDPFGAHTTDLRQELLRGVRERALLEAKTQRLFHEKAALEAELKTLLAQNADAVRLKTELAELQSQRERAAAAQTAIDAKARALAETRVIIARERQALEEERRQLSGVALQAADLAPDESAQAEIDGERQRLHECEERLREEASRLRQEAMQVAQERRRWHDDLDLLRAQEENLRAYEERLRTLQGQLEADRVLWFQGRAPASAQAAVSPAAVADDTALRSAWEKLQRASELLEAERATFRDERMSLREFDAALRRREEKVHAQESRVPSRQPASSGAAENMSTPSVEDVPAAGLTGNGASLKSITRAPFEIAKSIWSRGR